MTAVQPTTTGLTHEDFDLSLPGGRLRARRWGSPSAPLALCLPGLSANLVGFDYLCEQLAGESLQLVALDLRGRGRSETTAPGTYGWVNHARDAIAAADALGAPRFSLLGMSMGGAVAMTCAWLDASRIERMVLLDICGVPDATVMGPIGAAVGRLGTVYPSVEAFTAVMRQIGTIEPWSEHWQRYFEYELQPTEGGVASTTSREAVMEDAIFGAGAAAFGDDSGCYNLWRHLTMPVLLLRASRELLPGMGYVVPERDRDRFVREVATAQTLDVDANHYTINTHPASAEAIAAFLGTRRAG